MTGSSPGRGERIPALLLALLLLCRCVSAAAAEPARSAVSGTVSGDVQQVGFRAMILKEAIRLNLAGAARNLDDGTVQFSLQGRSQRIRNALASIRQGTQKSKNVTIQTSPSTFDPGLTTFTVFGWTSTSLSLIHI